MALSSLPASLSASSEWNNPSNPQYHIQTDEGPERYFRYQTLNGQYRKEKRLEDGTVIGTYAWIDDDGFLRQRDYIADSGGYRILKTKNVFVGRNAPVGQAVLAARKLPAGAGTLVTSGGSGQVTSSPYVPPKTTPYAQYPSSAGSGILPQPGRSTPNLRVSPVPYSPSHSTPYVNYPSSVQGYTPIVHISPNSSPSSSEAPTPTGYTNVPSTTQLPPLQSTTPGPEIFITSSTPPPVYLPSSTPAPEIFRPTSPPSTVYLPSTTPALEVYKPSSPPSTFYLPSTTPAPEVYKPSSPPSTFYLPSTTPVPELYKPSSPPSTFYLPSTTPTPEAFIPSSTPPTVYIPSTTPAPAFESSTRNYVSTTTRYLEEVHRTFTPDGIPITGYRATELYLPPTASTLPPPISSNSLDYYSGAPQYEHYKEPLPNPYLYHNGPTYPIDQNGHTYNGNRYNNNIGNGYDPQYQTYDGVSVTNDGFRYYIPRAYHEEQNLPGDQKSGSFGYIDPFGIRRVIYYNASPEKGFQHRKNNRYVGFNATPYDPRPV